MAIFKYIYGMDWSGNKRIILNTETKNTISWETKSFINLLSYTEDQKEKLYLKIWLIDVITE